MRALRLAGLLLLAGCATAPPAGLPPPTRADLGQFAMEARFALRTERPNEAPQSASGRLSWRHTAGGDSIFVANPLGQGIAEIHVNAGGAELRQGNGEVRRSADAAALLHSLTGYTLPLAELPAWLLGRPSSSGRLEADPAGRPRRLVDSGWRIDYDYDGDAADAPPARLTLQRDNELELRLRIEEWRSLPHD